MQAVFTSTIPAVQRFQTQGTARQKVQTLSQQTHFASASRVENNKSRAQFIEVLSNMLEEFSLDSPQEQQTQRLKLSQLATNINQKWQHLNPFSISPREISFRTEEGLIFLTEQEALATLKSGQFPDSALHVKDTYPGSTVEMVSKFSKKDEERVMQVISKNGDFPGEDPVYFLTGEHANAFMDALVETGDNATEIYERAKTISEKLNPFAV